MSTCNFMNLAKTTDFLPKHDLVFGSPINDPTAGIPLGDGDTGSLVWFEKDGIHININKTDLWDDPISDSEYVCSGEEENLTCLRHGGELVIRFDFPCFDMIYQKNFEARLSLADATLKIDSETPFSHIKAECFASNEKRVTALRCSYRSTDKNAPGVTLSRWGSRNFWRWYYRTIDKPEAGLDGTETIVGENRIYIKQKLNGTEFCLGVAIVGSNAAVKRINSRRGQADFQADYSGEFTLYWNISLGKTVEEALKNAEAALNSAVDEGYASMHDVHSSQWEAFWNTSFISIPHDYIENCWYLSLYYSNSECRGAYPPLFTNGIWGFRHDFYPWAHYFHYNMQHMYAPLETAGHGELAENYYKMRRDGLDNACRYASEFFKNSGAFYHDVVDFKGRGADFDSGNCTPGSQIAMAAYRHWRMNGDDEFLKKTALPIMKATAQFYLDKLKKGDDGLYHIYGTTAYEGNPPTNDTLTDIVMIRSLLGTLGKYVSEDERGLYNDILNNLPAYILVPLEDDEIKDGKFILGFGKGRSVAGEGKVLAIGFNDEGQIVRNSYGNPKRRVYGFPDIEMSPIYPAGVFGLKDKGSEYFDAMTNQILLHGEASECMMWCMMPIYLARMGMSEELYGYIEKMIERWLVYPNGLGADGPNGIDESRNRHKYYTVQEVKKNTSGTIEAYGFRHFDMETLPIISSAVCESLLQSYDGVLRICPAVKKNDAVRFTLFAEGGFKVSADVSPNGFYAAVESLRGECCRIKIPDFICEASVKVYIKGSDSTQETYAEPVWERTQNETYLVLDDKLKIGETAFITDSDLSSYTSEPDLVIPNKRWKTCGNVHLGTPPLAWSGSAE